MKKRLLSIVAALMLIMSISTAAYAATGFNKAVFNNAADVTVKAGVLNDNHDLDLACFCKAGDPVEEMKVDTVWPFLIPTNSMFVDNIQTADKGWKNS